MTVLAQRFDRRGFLVLSGGAAALMVVASQGCGLVEEHDTEPEPEPEPEPELSPAWSFNVPSTCRCQQCVRREMQGPWQLPDEDGPSWAHQQHEYECRRHDLPWFQGDDTWH